MNKILFLLIIIFFVSCGKNTIEEYHVCISKSDCLMNYECKFDLSSDKDYGSCVEMDSCNSESDCYGNLICSEDKKCTSTNFKIKTSELDSASRGISYSYQIIFTGLKDDNYYFEEIEDLPKGLSLSDKGLVSGVPTELGEYKFKVRLYGHLENENIYFNKNYTEKYLLLRVLGDICEPNPCTDLNKTKCSEDSTSEDGYKCDCDDGFILSGNDCIEDVCNNSNNPCTETNKTICTPNEDNTDYTCLCDEGYYSNTDGNCIVDNCAAEVNPCTEENRSQCINDEDENNGYKCICDDGLIEVDGVCIQDMCVVNPCSDSTRNKCVIDVTSDDNYRCDCSDTFYEGDDGVCYYDTCRIEQPCNTQANIDSYKTKCVGHEHSYTCECADKYSVDDEGNCYFDPCKVNLCREPYKSVCVVNEAEELGYECNCDDGYLLNSENKCYLVGDLCETAIEIDAGTNYVGDTRFMHSDYFATCGSYAMSNDAVYKITITENKLITATITPSEDTIYNAVIHIKDSCGDNSNQLACSDKDGENTDSAKIENKYLEAGTYYLFADGFSANNKGEYTLNYELTEPCYTDIDCSDDDTTFCDLDTHICKENKCLSNNLACENGECNRLDATCKCDEGFINSDSLTCVTDPCFNAPCTENSECVVSDNLLDYTCNCDTNFIKTGSGLCLQNPCTPTNTCTETNKTKCTYNILDDSIETICSCDDNFVDINGACVLTIADTCPGVNLPENTLLTGDTTHLHKNYKSKSNSANGNDAVYQFTITKNSYVKITMSTMGTLWDKYIYLRSTCSDSDSQIDYADIADAYSGADEVLEIENLDAGTYYVFADGYSSTSKGRYSLILEVEPLCSSNSDCKGAYQQCNIESGRCECLDGYSFGDDSTCYEECMQIGELQLCSDSLYECNLENKLCYKRTACTPDCQLNSHCNLDNLECICDTGFIKNEVGECVTDLCEENSVSCNGDYVSCNGVTGTCVCDDGYENYIDGSGCTQDNNPCTPIGSQCTEDNKTICVPTGTGDNDFNCICDAGFIENNHSVCIDDACDPNPCGINSVCTLNNSFHSRCSCKDGFEYDINNICQEIEGNSCNYPKLINLNDFSDTITDSLSDSQTLSCEANQNIDKVYKFIIDSDSVLSVNLITNDFNSVLAISKGCNGDFIELSCSSSISSLSLLAGEYYLHVKADNIGDFNLEFIFSESIYLKNGILTDAVINKAYDESIDIAGGVAPYQIELKANETLPNGLTLSQNHISGTPTAITPENNSFVVVVTDANNTIEEFTVELTVVDDSTPLKPKKGDLLINEIYYKVNNDVNNDGILDINDDEFIEIVNVSYKNLSLDGLSIWDSLDYSYRHDFTGTLSPDSSIVIFGGGDLSALSEANTIFVVASSGSLSLKNSDDIIRIIDENNNELESVSYTNNGVDGSINRNPDLTNSDFAPHSDVSGNNSLYSPGKKANGDSF